MLHHIYHLHHHCNRYHYHHYHHHRQRPFHRHHHLIGALFSCWHLIILPDAWSGELSAIMNFGLKIVDWWFPGSPAGEFSRWPELCQLRQSSAPGSMAARQHGSLLRWILLGIKAFTVKQTKTGWQFYKHIIWYINIAWHTIMVFKHIEGKNHGVSKLCLTKNITKQKNSLKQVKKINVLIFNLSSQKAKILWQKPFLRNQFEKKLVDLQLCLLFWLDLKKRP